MGISCEPSEIRGLGSRSKLFVQVTATGDVPMMAELAQCP